MVLTRGHLAVLAAGLIIGAALWITGDAIGTALARDRDDPGDTGPSARETSRAITDAVGDLTRWARSHESR